MNGLLHGPLAEWDWVDLNFMSFLYGVPINGILVGGFKYVALAQAASQYVSRAVLANRLRVFSPWT